MRPPPIPQRKFAPGLALKPKIIDPYDPNALHVADNHTFMRSQSNAEQVSGTWTTIDPDTHVRSWGKRSRYQDSDSGSDSSNVRPQSRAGRASNNEWVDRKNSLVDLVTDRSITIRMILSNVSHLETSTPDIDDSIRRHFVDAKDVMSNAWQARSAFEIRNQANLAPESATIIKNMIGDEVVSIAYQPIDDRVKYRDRKGNYIDGIDRGKMKKRYEDEWHKRLDDRDTEMKHVTKLKREFDALSPIEKTRRILRREANAKLLSILGAGLTTTDDLATFEYVPHIYLRLSKWTIRDQGSISDIPSSDNLGGLDDRRQPRDNGFNFRGPAPDIGYKPLSSHGDVTSGRGQSLQIAFEEDPAILLHVPEPRIFGQKPSYLANKHGPEQQIRDRSPVEARQPDAVPSKRKRPLHYRPVSDIPSRQYSAQSQPSQPRVVAQPSLADSARVSRTASSTASETVSALEPALDLAFLQDLTINRVDYENHHGSMNLYDRVKEVSSRRGRIVHVTLQEPVHFSSSAVVQRLFGGQIQEIQFFPAERMALVAFVVPSEAESFVTHVKNMRENHGHEFRR